MEYKEMVYRQKYVQKGVNSNNLSVAKCSLLYNNFYLPIICICLLCKYPYLKNIASKPGRKHLERKKEK